MNAREYMKAHEELMIEWKQKYSFQPKGELGQFVPDGIVDCEKYQGILFVLKDPNNGDGNYTCRGICDEVISSTNSGKTWFNPARWTQALLDGQPYEELKRMTHSRQHEEMKRVAIINVKKASGKAKVEDSVIFDTASKQKDMIKKQIVLCNPDVIITCGSVIFDALRTRVFGSQEISGNTRIAGMNYGGRMFTINANYHESITEIPVVEYRHPSTGCSIEKSYRDMLAIKRELLGK